MLLLSATPFSQQLMLLGFQVMEGVKEITKNGVKFMDGQEREFESIILATGYKSNVPTWLKVSIISMKFLDLVLSYYESSILFCLGHMHRGQTATNPFFSPCKKE